MAYKPLRLHSSQGATGSIETRPLMHIALKRLSENELTQLHGSTDLVFRISQSHDAKVTEDSLNKFPWHTSCQFIDFLLGAMDRFQSKVFSRAFKHICLLGLIQRGIYAAD
jgi:hypothetical protein